MKPSTLTTFGLSLLLIVSFLGCSESGEVVTDELPVEDTVAHEQLNLDSGEMRVFTLPAPLQIPTSLHNMDIAFDETLVASNDNAVSYGTQLDKAQNLGLSIVDLGYCAINGQGQLSINKMDHITKLAEQLGVTNSFNNEMIERFKSNQDDVDSLSWLILDSYESAHQYFQENEKEDLGLAILSGCLVEGIFLSTYHAEYSNDAQYYALLTQQKVYLENIILLLSQYLDVPEYKQLRKNLRIIRAAFVGIDANSKAPANLESIVKKANVVVADIRDSIISE